MNKFEVVGRRNIDGVAPGGVVEITDEDQQRRLIAAGHIKPAPAPKKPADNKES